MFQRISAGTNILFLGLSKDMNNIFFSSILKMLSLPEASKACATSRRIYVGREWLQYQDRETNMCLESVYKTVAEPTNPPVTGMIPTWADIGGSPGAMMSSNLAIPGILMEQSSIFGGNSLFSSVRRESPWY